MLTQQNTDWVRQIQSLFSAKLFVKVDSPETDLFQSGLLDSLSLVELLFNLEQAYGFKVELAELDLDDFRTISKIAAVVARSRNVRTAGGTIQ